MDTLNNSIIEFSFLNKDYLFNTEIFNNLITPLATIISIFIYFIALRFTFFQNRVILSQNLKPHYENEIENLKLEFLNRKIKIDLNPDATVHNGINYVTAIKDKILKLAQNPDFVTDIIKNKKGEIISRYHFQNSSYYEDLLEILIFTSELGPMHFLYDDLKLLIEEISLSKLIADDKKFLKKKIRREFLEQYMAFIGFMDEHPDMVPPVPLLFHSLEEDIEFKTLNKTAFRQNYDWFKQELYSEASA